MQTGFHFGPFLRVKLCGVRHSGNSLQFRVRSASFATGWHLCSFWHVCEQSHTFVSEQRWRLGVDNSQAKMSEFDTWSWSLLDSGELPVFQVQINFVFVSLCDPLNGTVARNSRLDITRKGGEWMMGKLFVKPINSHRLVWHSSQGKRKDTFGVKERVQVWRLEHRFSVQSANFLLVTHASCGKLLFFYTLEQRPPCKKLLMSLIFDEKDKIMKLWKRTNVLSCSLFLCKSGPHWCRLVSIYNIGSAGADVHLGSLLPGDWEK